MRAALLLMLLLLHGWASGQAGDSVRLVAILSKSGVSSTSLTRLPHTPGVTMAVEEINRHGGLLGKKVELIEIDSKSTALSARAAAREAVALQPIGVIGERISTMSLAIAPVLQQARIPMLSPTATHAELTGIGPFIFRMCYVDAFLGKALADFAYSDLKARRVAIFINASLKNSEELARHFTDRFRSRGGEVLLQADYVNDRSDFRDLLVQVRQKGADLLFIPGGRVDSGTIMRQAREQGVTVPFLGGDGWGVDIYKHAGAAVNGAHRAVQWHRDLPGAANASFVRAFEARFGPARSDGEALSYDAVMALADAVRRAGSFDPARVRDALAKTSGLAGVSGTLEFDAERNPLKPVVIVRQQGERNLFVKVVSP